MAGIRYSSIAQADIRLQLQLHCPGGYRTSATAPVSRRISDFSCSSIAQADNGLQLQLQLQSGRPCVGARARLNMGSLTAMTRLAS